MRSPITRTGIDPNSDPAAGLSLRPVPVARPQESPPADDNLEPVEALMTKLAAGERFERLGAIVQEHLLTGGKKLRARLALAAVEALGGEPSTGIAWAAACELLHNATLIHDDLQDRDEYRRGRFSVWVRHGEAQAINAGDLLLMLPYTAIDHIDVDAALKWELTRALAKRAEETVRGQSLEMTLFTSCRWDWPSYTEASMGKTSALMTLPVHGAALLSGRHPDTSARLADCFRNLGLLFQMQDDVLDLFGNKGRDKPGGDIREGRVSALVVEYLTQNPDSISWLGPILGKSREETTDREVNEVADRFRAEGTLGAVLDKIREVRTLIFDSEPLKQEPRLMAVAHELTKLALAPIKDLMEAQSV